MTDDKKNTFLLIERLSINILDDVFFSIKIEDLSINQCIMLCEISILCRVTLTTKELKEIFISDDLNSISKNNPHFYKNLKLLKENGYIDLNYAGKKINPIITLTRKGADVADVIRSHLNKLANLFGQEKIELLYNILQEMDDFFRKYKKEILIK